MQRLLRRREGQRTQQHKFYHQLFHNHLSGGQHRASIDLHVYSWHRPAGTHKKSLARLLARGPLWSRRRRGILRILVLCP